MVADFAQYILMRGGETEVSCDNTNPLQCVDFPTKNAMYLFRAKVLFVRRALLLSETAEQHLLHLFGQIGSNVLARR